MSTTTKTAKGAYATTFHRDGSVTVWNVYTQGWQRRPASSVSDEVLASLPANERTRVVRMGAK